MVSTNDTPNNLGFGVQRAPLEFDPLAPQTFMGVVQVAPLP